ncbi:MAG: hypothetical protein QOG28_482, partial [Trebonia sp.]|nr:hypothetical protein [Trebonia sp.]
MFPSERTPCSLDHRDRDQEGGGGDRAPVGLASWLDKFAGEGDPLVEQPGSCAAADGGARLVQANGEGVLEVACSDRAVAHGECAGSCGASVIGAAPPHRFALHRRRRGSRRHARNIQSGADHL